MTTEAFEDLYNRLNPAQKEAVDATEGPVMVVAGPGTGKTQVLTLRIANILRQTDAEPKSILALTFTESGVISMRRRLAEIIGSPAYSVVISTFHGFCNDIITNYPEEFPRIIGSQSITEVDQIEVVRGIVETLPLEELRPFGDPLYYLRAIVARLNELKREGVSPEAFANVVADERRRFDEIPDLRHASGPHAGKMKGEYQRLERKVRKNAELARVYAEYRKRLEEERRYDYDDMIMEVLEALTRNRDLLLTLQEQHQYLLVDEHQDTNNAQNRILELLSSFHPNPNLFIVGDEKQAIFRFQGASLENFNYFRKLYPEAKFIALTENYRSNQAILDTAENVLRGPAPLVARAGLAPEKVRVFSFSRPEVETYFIAHDIKERLAAGAAPEGIAVLYRDNRDAFPVARMLERVGIPFAIESDRDILTDPEIRKLILLFRAADAFGSPRYFMEALHVDFLGIPPLDVWKLIDHATRGKVSVFDIARDPVALERIGLEAPDAVHGFYAKLSRWATAARNAYLPEFFESVVRESGFLAHILGSENPVESLGRLAAFFDEVRELVEKHRDYRLAEFLAYLAMLDAHGILVKRPLIGNRTGRIRLMTAHRSKGLEFDHVYIMGAADGHWGNRRRPELLPLVERAYSLSGADIGESDALSDERRLFYVALTRAKRSATVSYARANADAREQLPCVFIEELGADLVAVGDAARVEAEFSERREIVFRPPAVRSATVKDKEFIRDLFLSNGLSVTALNNYLSCPWRYFYTNLLRIPQAKTKHQMYGTAVHGALRDFFANVKDRVLPKEFLEKSFESHLLREPLSERDFTESLAKGRTALAGYYDRYRDEWRVNVLTEFSVPGVFLAPDIRLTGTIDKIEFTGVGADVNVVDYKTGRPKTRGVIEGATKSASRRTSGDIKRQLVFYNILLNLYESGRYQMVSGDIDFIEPDERGRYRKEQFAITPAEVEEVTALTLSMAEDVLSLAFWDRRCDDATCEFCALREMMR
jgi:DNA helicase II / ATP-dependent DNA helicase PcrA